MLHYAYSEAGFALSGKCNDHRVYTHKLETMSVFKQYKTNDITCISAHLSLGVTERKTKQSLWSFVHQGTIIYRSESNETHPLTSSEVPNNKAVTVFGPHKKYCNNFLEHM